MIPEEHIGALAPRCRDEIGSGTSAPAAGPHRLFVQRLLIAAAAALALILIWRLSDLASVQPTTSSLRWSARSTLTPKVS